MNKKLKNINFINFQNILLAGASILFVLLSTLILFMQRNGYFKTIDYENIYIGLSIIFILFLVYSLISYIYPIVQRVGKKKVNTFNNKFTLYFITIALTPAALLGILGFILITLGINDWFNDKVKNVINNSVFVAESYLEEHKETIKGDIYQMSSDLNNASQTLNLDKNKLMLALKTQALVRSLPEAFILNESGVVYVSAFQGKTPLYSPTNESFKRANNGEMVIMSSTQVNKVYALMKLINFESSYLFAGRSMDANVISALNETRSAKIDYSILERNRNQISLIFFLIYIIITLVLILISTIIGIKIADRIVTPISSIIKASNNISKGSYKDKIYKTNDYVELNRLADAFNKMSSDIVKQKNQLVIAKKYETWSDMSRKIAHEIKNPLTPIQLSSERLLKLIKTNENNLEIKDCIDTITRQVEEIGHLVNEFSNFARLPDPKFEKIKINSLLEKTIGSFKNHKNLEIRSSFPDSQYYINADISQINRAFQNLIINAINSIEESSVEKGIIAFNSYINDNNKYVVTLIDNGIGLKYDKDEILKPYFTTRKKSGGTGLGLSIVEKILFDHQADFEIINRTDGITGAEINITFNLV